MVLPVGGGYGGADSQQAAQFDPNGLPWHLKRLLAQNGGLPPVGVGAGQPVGVAAVPQPVPNPQAQQGPPAFAPGQGLPALQTPPAPAPAPPPSTPFQGNETILPLGGGRERLVSNYKTDAQGNRTPFVQSIQEFGHGAKAPEGDYGSFAQLPDRRQAMQDFLTKRVGVQPPNAMVGVAAGPAAAAGQSMTDNPMDRQMQAMQEFSKMMGFVSPGDKAQQEKLAQIGEKNKGELAVAETTAKGHVEAQKAKSAADAQMTRGGVVDRWKLERDAAGLTTTPEDIARQHAELAQLHGDTLTPQQQAILAKPKRATDEKVGGIAAGATGGEANFDPRTGRSVLSGGSWNPNALLATAAKTDMTQPGTAEDVISKIMNEPKLNRGLEQSTKDVEINVLKRLNSAGAFTGQQAAQRDNGDAVQEVELGGGTKARKIVRSVQSMAGAARAGKSPIYYEIQTPHGGLSELNDIPGIGNAFEYNLPYLMPGSSDNAIAEAKAGGHLINALHGRLLGRPAANQAMGAGSALGNVLK